MPHLKVLNWDVEWAEAQWKAAEMRRRIDQQAAGIICLTEADPGRLKLPQDGNSICAQGDRGPTRSQGQEGRREHLLWSGDPWDAVDEVGIPSLPAGRFVSGVQRPELGRLPSSGFAFPTPARGRVEGTRWNRQMWQDHEEYLGGLSKLLKRAPRERLVVVGISTSRSGSAAPRRFIFVKHCSPPWGRT